MSEYWDTVAKRLITLSDDEAKRYMDYFYVPLVASRPNASDMLLEAVPRTIPNETYPAASVQQSDSIDSIALPQPEDPTSSRKETQSSSSKTLEESSERKKINKKPCGLCQQKRRKCEVVQTHPVLCKICEKTKATSCPPHIPNITSRENKSGLDNEYQDSSESSARNNFVYESGGL